MSVFTVILPFFLASVLTIVIVAIMMLRRNDYCPSMAAVMPVMIRPDPDAYANTDLLPTCARAPGSCKLAYSEA